MDKGKNMKGKRRKGEGKKGGGEGEKKEMKVIGEVEKGKLKEN